MLNGPVTDAATGVELVRRHERPGRTGIQAASACPAVVGSKRLIGFERDVDEERPKQGEAAKSAIDQHRVLADPSQTGQPGKVAFEQRRGVGQGAAVGFGSGDAEPGEKGVEPPPEQIVIIGASGVPGHFPLSRSRRS